MNTGLHDVWNLVWKLDLVLHGRGNDGLLESYSAERRPVIKHVIETTDFLTKRWALRTSWRRPYVMPSSPWCRVSPHSSTPSFSGCRNSVLRIAEARLLKEREGGTSMIRYAEAMAFAAVFCSHAMTLRTRRSDRRRSNSPDHFTMSLSYDSGLAAASH
jgi:hypothetical protein